MSPWERKYSLPFVWGKCTGELDTAGYIVRIGDPAGQKVGGKSSLLLGLWGLVVFKSHLYWTLINDENLVGKKKRVDIPTLRTKCFCFYAFVLFGGFFVWLLLLYFMFLCSPFFYIFQEPFQVKVASEAFLIMDLVRITYCTSLSYSGFCSWISIIHFL